MPAPRWDTRPEFISGEAEALDALVSHFRKGGKSLPHHILKRLSHFLLPLRDTLIRMHAARAPYNSAIHDITLQMQRLRKTYWAWTQTEWSEVICSTEGEFHPRFGASGNCRQYVMALAWLLCGFDRLDSCGVFYQYRLCLKIFGRQSTDSAVNRLDSMMQRLGYVQGDGRNKGIRNTMCMAMLIQREPVPEKLKTETLNTFLQSDLFISENFLPRCHASLLQQIQQLKRLIIALRSVAGLPVNMLRWPIFRQNSCHGVNDDVSTWYYVPHPFHQQ